MRSSIAPYGIEKHVAWIVAKAITIEPENGPGPIGFATRILQKVGPLNVFASIP